MRLIHFALPFVLAVCAAVSSAVPDVLLVMAQETTQGNASFLSSQTSYATATPESNVESAAAQANGTITGIVRAADTGLPLGSATVRVYNLAGSIQTTRSTNFSTGIFSISIPSGNYKIEFQPPYSKRDYASEWYDNQRSFDSATTVIVADNATTANINADLDVGGKVTGRIAAAVSGSPINSQSVRIYTSTTSLSELDFETTDARGVYTFTGLIAGSYFVAFNRFSPAYLDEYFSDKRTLATADPIPVVLGQVVSNIDGALDTGGSITGRVTSAKDSAPMKDAHVFAFTSTIATSAVAFAVTDATGGYAITNLLADSYYLKFQPPFGSGLIEEYYSNKPSLAAADAIAVTLNSIMTADASLDQAGQIQGIVTAADTGASLKDVWVTAYLPDECNQPKGVAYARTNESGAYTLTQLTAGSYWIKFDPSVNDATTNYLAEFYSNKLDFTAADAVNVSLNTTTTGINAALDRKNPGSLSGGITGRITGMDTGQPLDDIVVSVHDNSGSIVQTGFTDASGIYTVTGLATGAYRVRFEPSSFGGTKAYAAEYYNDKSTLTDADAINVTAPVITSGVDAALERGGQITGRIIAVDGGVPLKFVTVFVYDAAGNLVDLVFSDASGIYTTTGLATGSFKLQFSTRVASGLAGEYLGEFYSDKPSLEAADLIGVTKPNVTSAVDTQLARGGKITGKVTAADSLQPLVSVRVSAIDSNGREVKTTLTDLDGTYELDGLPTGLYRVRFHPLDKLGKCGAILQAYEGEYYDDKPSLDTANVLNIIAPAEITGIDAALAVTPIRDRKVNLPIVIR